MKRFSLKKEIPITVYLFWCLFLIFATSFLLPAGDDWAYSSPVFKFDENLLMPQATFWRPIDRLWAYLLGKAPSLFPFLNHLEIVLMYVLAIFILERIAVKLQFNRATIWIVCIYAAISPAGMATLYSVDSLNQATSLTFGLMGLLVYISMKGMYRYTIWILCSIISVLSKESGIVYFILVPFFNEIFYYKEWKNRNKKHIYTFLNFVGIGCFFIVLYFIIRFYLQGSVALGEDEGRYQVSVFSMNTISNFVLLFSVCFSVIDTLSLFAEDSNKILLGTTFMASCCVFSFLIFRFYRTIKEKKYYWEIFILTICLLLVTAPHIVIGRSGEMHAYPTLFWGSLLIGVFCDGIKLNRWVKSVFVIFILTALLVDGHKYNSIYQYGKLGEFISKQFYEKTKSIPQSILFINVREEDKEGYSVFTKPAAVACGTGRGVKPLYNYQYPIILDFMEVETDKDRMNEIRNLHNIKKSSYEYIWSVRNNEAIVIDLKELK